MHKLFLAAAVTLVAQLGHATPVDPLPWSDLIVFGDSLSDQGNTGPGAVASNVQTWASQLGTTPWREGGTNYAVIGATAAEDIATFDLDDQIGLFRDTPATFGPDPLVVLYFGGNDLLNGGDAASVAAALSAIGTGLSTLATEFGFTRFALPGLPDLAQIPRYVGAPEAPLVSAASQALNAGLAQLAQNSSAAGLDVTYVDIAQIFSEIIADPADFGFSNVTKDCQRGQISCEGFLFWDDIHPTEATHTLIAETVVSTVTPAPVPLPAGLWFMLGGIGILLLQRRRPAT